MEKIKDDNYYIGKVKEHIEFINTHMKNISLDELKENELLQDSMLFRLTQVYEYSRGLSEEYKSKSNIPWSQISGIRNRIIHDYGKIDWKIIYETLTISIPKLFEQL